MYRRILVTNDGSNLSKKAVGHAIALVKLCNAELIGLSVVARCPTSYFEGDVALAPEEVSRIESQ